MSKSENKRIESKRNLKRLKQALERREFRKVKVAEKKIPKPIKKASLLVLLFMAAIYTSLISSLFIY